MPVSTIHVATGEVSSAIAQLRSAAYQVSGPTPELLALGVLITAYSPASGEGYLLYPAEVRLTAQYGPAALDPDWGNSRPRHEREGTRDRAAAYVEAALARALTEMASTGEGGRNQALNRLTHGLGRLEALGLQQERAFREMLEAAIAVGLPESEVLATMRGAWRRGAESPAKLPPDREPPQKTTSLADAHRQRLRHKLGGKR